MMAIRIWFAKISPQCRHWTSFLVMKSELLTQNFSLGTFHSEGVPVRVEGFWIFGLFGTGNWRTPKVVAPVSPKTVQLIRQLQAKNFAFQWATLRTENRENHHWEGKFKLKPLDPRHTQKTFAMHLNGIPSVLHHKTESDLRRPAFYRTLSLGWFEWCAAYRETSCIFNFTKFGPHSNWGDRELIKTCKSWLLPRSGRLRLRL